MDTGKSLRVCMAEANKNNRDIMRDFKISSPTVTRMRTRKDGMTSEWLNRFSEYFGLKVSEFVAKGE